MGKSLPLLKAAVAGIKGIDYGIEFILPILYQKYNDKVIQS